MNYWPLGRGWEHNFETRLKKLSGENVVIHWSANRKNTFVHSDDGAFIPQGSGARHDTLAKNDDGSYTLTRRDQSIYNFDAAGRLTAMSEQNGRRLVLERDAEDRPTKITEPVSGQFFTLNYHTNGLLEKVTDILNREVTL